MSPKSEMSTDVVVISAGMSSQRFRHCSSKGDSSPSSSNFWWISLKRAAENTV